MASASLHTPASSRKPTATAAAILTYLAAGHTNTDAAAYFGIHERSVRRIKQRAAERSDRCADDRLPPIVSASPTTIVSHPAAPLFPATADDRAGDHTMWRCPATGELMPVVPGTHRKDWERERVETHARHVAVIMSRSADRTPDTTPAAAQPDWTGHAPFTASHSERTGPDAGALGAYVAAQDRTPDTTPRPGDAQPGHARPEIEAPGAEAPELPSEAFEDPSPNQPAGDQAEEQPRGPHAMAVQRVVVRVVEPRQLGGLVGWLATGPMVGVFA